MDNPYTICSYTLYTCTMSPVRSVSKEAVHDSQYVNARDFPVRKKFRMPTGPTHNPTICLGGTLFS